MNIQGSMLTGKQVDIDIAGDLSIQSDKTGYTYRQKNAAIGVGIALIVTDTDVLRRELVGNSGAFSWSALGKESISTNINGFTLHVEMISPTAALCLTNADTVFLGYQGNI